MRPEDRLSDHVKGLAPSGIRRFFDMANALKGQVISLSIGEPDFVTPWSVREAGIYSLEQGQTHYTANAGVLELREAIARYAARRFELHYNPEDEIMVTVGGSEAIDDAVRALINPGDEVLVPEPAYVAYQACVKLAGAVPVPLRLEASEGFVLKPQQLEAAITPKTRGLILAYPNNPTGGVMERRDYEALQPVLDAHPRITLISDELYAELTYEPAAFCSPATLPGMRERTVVIGGFSKAFAMTGWRIGYAMAPRDILQAMNKIHQYVIMSAPTTAQYAAIDALENGAEAVGRMRQAYNERRRFLVGRLRQLGLPVHEPLGAFYVFPDISGTGIDSNTFCERLLQEYKVAIIPGDAFGEAGKGFVRISYAASLENIETALDRIGSFLDDLAEERSTGHHA